MKCSFHCNLEKQRCKENFDTLACDLFQILLVFSFCVFLNLKEMLLNSPCRKSQSYFYIHNKQELQYTKAVLLVLNSFSLRQLKQRHNLLLLTEASSFAQFTALMVSFDAFFLFTSVRAQGKGLLSSFHLSLSLPSCVALTK